MIAIQQFVSKIRARFFKSQYLDPDFDKRGATTNEEIDLFWQDEQRVKEYLVQERLDFFQEVAHKIPYSEDVKSVIDIGCGSGHVLFHYSKIHHIKEEALVACEISIHALLQVNKLLPRVNLLRVDLLLLPHLLNHKFDLAIATEILEHLQQPQKYLKSIIEILNLGGKVLITIPNGDLDNWSGHVNFWNKNQFKEFLGKFNEIELVYSETLSSNDLLFVIKKVR